MGSSLPTLLVMYFLDFLPYSRLFLCPCRLQDCIIFSSSRLFLTNIPGMLMSSATVASTVVDNSTVTVAGTGIAPSTIGRLAVSIAAGTTRALGKHTGLLDSTYIRGPCTVMPIVVTSTLFATITSSTADTMPPPLNTTVIVAVPKQLWSVAPRC